MSKNVTVSGTDKVQVVFSSPGETPSNPSAGKPIVVTGNPKDKNATVHGSTAQGVVVDNPA
jgi:hypothetical protein